MSDQNRRLWQFCGFDFWYLSETLRLIFLEYNSKQFRTDRAVLPQKVYSINVGSTIEAHKRQNSGNGLSNWLHTFEVSLVFA